MRNRLIILSSRFLNFISPDFVLRIAKRLSPLSLSGLLTVTVIDGAFEEAGFSETALRVVFKIPRADALVVFCFIFVDLVGPRVVVVVVGGGSGGVVVVAAPTDATRVTLG